MCNRTVQANGFESRFLPAGDNVPAFQMMLVSHVCRFTTQYLPILPLVKWSNEEKRFARRKGGSKDVEAVMAKDRFFVTAAMALMGIVGSVMGH